MAQELITKIGEQKGKQIYDRQIMNSVLEDTFNRLNLNHGHMTESITKIKDVLLFGDLTDKTPPSSKLILIGGGSGTAVAGRSLYKARISNFTMLANTGEMGRDQQTGETIGAGMIFEEIADAIDMADILKQSIHSTPEELRGNIHLLLDQQRHPHMRFGYLVLEALRQIKGDSQKAVDFLNNWMNNPYRVIPSTTDKTELFLDMNGHKISSNDYAKRNDPYKIADRPVTHPEATLSIHAKQAIEKADTIIIGPGDVFFSVLPHWGIGGFQTALVENAQANIILIVNLTARKYDTTDFKLTDYLDLYSRFLPINKNITAVINNGKIPAENPIIDNISELNNYRQYQLVRGDITGQHTTGNNQLMHDESNFGNLLKKLID